MEENTNKMDIDKNVPSFSTVGDNPTVSGTFASACGARKEQTPSPRGERWADMSDDDEQFIQSYDDIPLIWNQKLIPNVSRGITGNLRVKIPKGLENMPFTKSLSNALLDHNIEIIWDPNTQVRGPPELVNALEQDGDVLGEYVDNLYRIIGSDVTIRDRTRPEVKILEGLYNIRELRAVMRSFHHKYTGSLEGKPISATWTLDLRLETLWEILGNEDRKSIHNLIDSTPFKEKVKGVLAPLFGDAAANQLVDGYEIAFRHMIRDNYTRCAQFKPEIAAKMRLWFENQISERMPTQWALLSEGYQLTKVTVPLTANEKQRLADLKPTHKEKQEILHSKMTKVVQKRLLPLINSALITTINAKKVSTAWNNAFESFAKEQKEKKVDPKRIGQISPLMKSVNDMRKLTIDIFSIFKKHTKTLRDEIFQKLKNEKSTDRRKTEKVLVTAYEFNSELQKMKPELEFKERNLLEIFCGYFPNIHINDIDDMDISSIESRISQFLTERYDILLYPFKG